MKADKSEGKNGITPVSKQRFGKKDLIVLLVVAAVIVVIACCFFFRKDAEGGMAVVTVDGKEYGRYPLSKEQEIPIVIDGEETNLLIIKDGKADVTEADCPDQICVNQKPVSKEHETIVCLPNKVVVEILGGETADLDTIAN